MIILILVGLGLTIGSAGYLINSQNEKYDERIQSLQSEIASYFRQIMALQEKTGLPLGTEKLPQVAPAKKEPTLDEELAKENLKPAKKLSKSVIEKLVKEQRDMLDRGNGGSMLVFVKGKPKNIRFTSREEVRAALDKIESGEYSLTP